MGFAIPTPKALETTHGASATTTEYSQAMEIGDANAVEINVVASYVEGATGDPSFFLTVSAEQSADLQNWSALSGQLTIDTPSTQSVQITSIVQPYIRLKYVLQNGAEGGAAATSVTTVTVDIAKL